MTDAPVLELELSVSQHPDQVWKALTEPRWLQCWFPMRSSGDAAAGGKLLLSWGADCEWETHITAFEPGRHLQWMDELPDPEQPDVVLPMVDWWLEPTAGGGTRLRLVQSGFDPDSDWQDYYDALRRGWTYFVDLLGCYLEHHFGQDRQMIYRRGKSLVPRAELWSGLLGALGLSVASVEALEGASGWAQVALHDDRATEAEIRVAESPHVLAARFPAFNQASLFIELEGLEDQPTCGVWLSTYGLDEAQHEELSAAIHRVCQGLIAE